MNYLVPEPEGDIRAQFRALLDRDHPKEAVFVVPEDRGHVPQTSGLLVEHRREGSLYTRREGLAVMFCCAPSDEMGFDRAMARILGLPQDKRAVFLACEGRPMARARIVQACDADGWVVTEAAAGPDRLAPTMVELKKHVPEGGALKVMTPIEALGRRMLLREAGN